MRAEGCAASRGGRADVRAGGKHGRVGAAIVEEP
jgi:hypothetical protein